MDELIVAMTRWQPDEDPSRWYFDLETGDVACSVDEDVSGVPDEVGHLREDDPDRFPEIPVHERQLEYDLMVTFSGAVEDAEVREELQDALAGKGAFGRFRAIVREDDRLHMAWETARRDALVEEARRWLRSMDIDPVFELRPLPESRRRHDDRPAPPSAGLLDMLLLGGPDGKTELMEGRVARVIACPSPADARQQFKRLAREICEHFGKPWRRRFAQSTNDFELGRAHLRVEDRRVWLEIEVSRKTWDLFCVG